MSTLKTYLNYVRPKLILTLIDNNKTFYKLKEMYPKAKTMLVQNAWRSADGDDILKIWMNYWLINLNAI